MRGVIGIVSGLVVFLGHITPARSTMYDVVTVKLQEGCRLDKSSKLVDDVAAYTKDNGA